MGLLVASRPPRLRLALTVKADTGARSAAYSAPVANHPPRNADDNVGSLRNAMTPILTPFLVRVRIPDLNPPDEGAIRLYIAVCETEAQAIEATIRAVRSNWQVEAVVGEAKPELIQRINPQPFHAVPIA